MPDINQQANDVVVSSTGNLGIGTISPSAKLQVEGDTGLHGAVAINGPVNLIGSASPIQLAGVPGNSGQVMVSNGTATPEWKNIVQSSFNAAFNLSYPIGYYERQTNFTLPDITSSADAGKLFYIKNTASPAAAITVSASAGNSVFGPNNGSTNIPSSGTVGYVAYYVSSVSRGWIAISKTW